MLNTEKNAEQKIFFNKFSNSLNGIDKIFFNSYFIINISMNSLYYFDFSNPIQNLKINIVIENQANLRNKKPSIIYRNKSKTP